MGCVYRHKGRETWWIKYRSGGNWQYESAQSKRKEDAKRLLRLREGDTAKGVSVTSQVGRLKFDEARDDLIRFHQANGRDTTKLEARIRKHLTPYFIGKKMADITTATIDAYKAKRQADIVTLHSGATKRVANGTINRELAWLKHMFSLACKARKLMAKPEIAMLKENNVRQGFFEPEHLRAVLAELPEDLRPVVRFAYITGWRIKSEVLSLEWRQVDMKAGVIRLEPGTTKNGEGREFPFTRELRTLLEAQLAEHERLKKRNHVVPWVFFRMVANGRGGPLRPKPITSMSKAFQAACKRAGLGHRILHDFRRTAVRNFVRAGIPEAVAMRMSGHKTRSVFDRYNIVSERDLRIAAERLDSVAM